MWSMEACMMMLHSALLGLTTTYSIPMGSTLLLVSACHLAVTGLEGYLSNMAGDGEEIRSTLFTTTDKIPIAPILLGEFDDPVLFSSLFLPLSSWH
jgi:hypothetical protein